MPHVKGALGFGILQRGGRIDLFFPACIHKNLAFLERHKCHLFHIQAARVTHASLQLQERELI